MGKVISDVSMSLDGFIAGPNDELDQVHAWMFPATGQMDERDAEVSTQFVRAAGAVVMGRRTFDVGVKENGWSGWVDHPPFRLPVFVPSHDVPPKAAGSMYTFITDGMQSTIERAMGAAGGRNVVVNGGADTIQQCLRAGLLDEMQIHLVPVLLGRGIRLFDRLDDTHFSLERTSVVESPAVTHLRFRVVS